MTSHGSRLGILLVASLIPVTASATGPGDEAPEAKLDRGVRLRVTTKDGSDVKPVIGRLWAADERGLALYPEREGEPTLTVPWADVSKVEARRRATLKRRAWRGAVPGFVVGALLGAVSGMLVDDNDRSKYVLAGSGIFGASGLALGALVGMAVPSSDWQRVQPSDLVIRSPEPAPPTALALPPDRPRRLFLGGGASFNALRNGGPGSRNPVAPGGSVGLFVTRELSVSIEGVAPATVFEAPNSEFRIRPSTVSALVGLHWEPHRAVRLGALAGLSRQRSDERYWSVTLGAEAMFPLSRHLAIVPQVRLDTEGGRVSSGVGLRPGIGLRAMF